MQRTISIMTGKGSLNHNDRKFTAKNVDAGRTENNIVYCNENIKQVYHKLFDEAVARYNAKQTRKDRMIDDYYEKIRTGKQEKPFTEIIIQIGDKDNMGAETENGQLAKKILEDRKQDCIDDISKYKKAEDFALAIAKKLEDEVLKMPEPTPLMPAKTYKTKYAEPFIKKLIKIIKDLARKCFRAEKAEKQSVSEIARLTDENKKLKSRVWDLNIENSQLKVQIRDFDRLKKHLGIDKVKEILQTVGKSRQKKKTDILR